MTSASASNSSLKPVLHVQPQPRSIWIGDGFRAYHVFEYRKGTEERTPFLLLHHVAPMEFEPNLTNERRGVGAHPHRGFETVTLVYQGEVEHRDSTGAGGVIGPGDVQWMTAGSGVMHEEFHSQAYSEQGGPFEMVQLWVNLPAKDKMTPPRYQSITADTIPQIELPQNAGLLRVIAGDYQGSKGPAATHSPMNVWDMRLNASASASLPQPEGWTLLLFVLEGAISANGQAAQTGALITFDRQGSGLELSTPANQGARLLIMAGQPIDEPLVASGPFVMNSKAEIAAAYNDLTFGKFSPIAESATESSAA